MELVLNESTASRRCVPIWLVGSDGTSPATGESGSTFFFYLGGADYGSGGSLSAVSAGGGHYSCNFAASKLSVLGSGAVYYRSGNALPASTPIRVVKADSNNSQDLGLAAFSVVTLAPGTHSNVTIQGVTRLNSSVTLNADTHSGATIQGLTRINSSVTIANADYSSVTVRVSPQAYSGLTVGVSNIALGSYSGVTFGVDNIKPQSYSGVSFEVMNINRSSMQSQADRILLRALATESDAGRSVQDALRVLRNRVALAGSIMTVYTEDDATSAWTSSIATSAVASPVIGFDPAGP